MIRDLNYYGKCAMEEERQEQERINKKWDEYHELVKEYNKQGIQYANEKAYNKIFDKLTII